MANALFDSGRNAFARGEIQWKSGGDSIKCLLLTNEYTPDLGSHSNLSDIPASARRGTGGGQGAANAPLMNLLDPTKGICDAGDVTFGAMPSETFDYILIFKDTGNESTSSLIGIIDSGAGLPVTGNGGTIIIKWDNGANKIFKL